MGSMSSRGQNLGAVGQQIRFHTGKPFQLGLLLQQYIRANHEPLGAEDVQTGPE